MRNYTFNIVFIAIFACFITNAFGQTENTKPNIILIFADDLGYTDVGFNRPANFPEEYGVIPTPELDALASNGVIAQNAHVAHPFCGPSRAALLTGVYPHRICAQYNLMNSVADPNGVTTNEKFFSKVLQENNYNTAAIGKWHVGVSNDFIPNNRGFDYFFGMLGGGHQYFESDYEAQWYNSGGTVTNEYRVPLLRNQTYVTANEFDNDEYLTDILTEEAVDYIDSLSTAGSTDPFFMYLAYNAPHTPLQAPQSKIDAFDAANGDGTPGSTFSSVVANSPDILNANIPGSWTGTDEEYRATLVEDRLVYATMVSIMDEGIGLVVDALTANGILNNTLIVFMSDNGGKLRQAGAVNYPLTQGKGSVDEGGHRVPMFMHWPDELSAGQTYDHLISSIDLYPTFLDLAGAPVPAGKLLEGKAVMNKVVANQDARPGENMYVMRPQLGFHNGAIMKGDYKIVKKGNNNTTAGFKLYNIMTDPGETTDIRGTEPNAETLIDGMLTEGVAWVSEFQDVKPCFYDNDGDGSGHPHSFLWNDGTLPNYDGFFGMPLITDPELISVTGETDAVEGQTDGVFTMSLPTGILADSDITVTYTVSGEATNGTDYTMLSGTLTILEGTNGTDIIIVASEDGMAEGTETVVIQLVSTSFGSINTTPAQINISDVTLPTTLTTGDVAIVGYKADAGNVAELAFVILKDINPGTSITMSNRSWKDDGSFNLGGGGSPYAIDDVFSWTATSTHNAGTIFKLERSGIVTTVINNVETAVGNTVQTFGTDGDWDLSPAGDSVLMYSGATDTHPSDNSNLWLTGLNTNGVENASIQNAGWAVGGGNAYCELPAALVGFDIDVTGGDVSNPYDQNFGVYTGNASGDPATVRASVNNYTNWILNESNAYFLWNNSDTVDSDAGDIFLGQVTLSSNDANAIDLGLRLFPNPTRDYFNVKLNGNIQSANVELLSLTGKVLRTLNTKQNQSFKMDVSDLPSGIYLIKVSSDSSSQIGKIVKL
ncbi:sulfatase-like hydrolase/transferase [Hyunsoonleella sp. SJ7]|uniref:Sulfatase-like hydrolase/transferase n=1 Tax=Hyunsoonleella aquatilis TaxID=2762758 RepID=A0A923KLV9_9FLAO|nr:sulfatase-like hydrolase/transferase [Hyunsoonleella aquatilis]MBC3759203.1 sulfatase-like hydrolase/transferase [Hyunsoonleella aquatilis]